jgi:hypothetical protein
MFKDITEYITLSQNERQRHLVLDEKCIEIGGYLSTFYVGLLAHYLKTTIPPKGSRVILCHACGNGKCSNPKHLYWGTDTENLIDRQKHGTYVSPYVLTVNKYGEEKTKRMLKESASKGGKNGGGHNRLTEDKISERLELIKDLSPVTRGFVGKVAQRWNVSHTQARRLLKQYNIMQ